MAVPEKKSHSYTDIPVKHIHRKPGVVLDSEPFTLQADGNARKQVGLISLMNYDGNVHPVHSIIFEGIGSCHGRLH